MGVDEEGTFAQLKTHRGELVDPKISEYGGRIIKTTGNGMLVEFASVVDAMRWAIEMQRGMAKRNALVPEDKRIEFRIGIHHGDMISEAGDTFGDVVKCRRASGSTLNCWRDLCVVASARRRSRQGRRDLRRYGRPATKEHL
jgi:class 3 adenylate cyclase